MKTLILVILLATSLEWDGKKTTHSEREWLKILGSDRFQTMRKRGTDKAYIGKYAYPPKTPSLYECAACSLPLFRSEDQYDAGGGFPCFTKAIASKNIYYEEDFRPPFKRYEVVCRQCDCHLGHVFRDGPPPKYLRYCINSSALTISSIQPTTK